MPRKSLRKKKNLAMTGPLEGNGDAQHRPPREK